MKKESTTGNCTLLKESWHILWRKPTLFFPQIFGYFILVLLGGIFYGIFELLFGSLETATPASMSFLMFIIIIFLLVSAYIKSLEIRIFSHIIRDKKVYLSRAFTEAYTDYKRVVVLLLLKIVISIPFSIIFYVAYIVAFESLSTNVAIVTTLLIGLAGVGLFLGPMFIFLEPLLAIKKLSAWKLLELGWENFRKNTKYLIRTVFIIIGIIVLISIITILVSNLALNTRLTEATIFIINIITGVYITTFIYKACYAKFGKD